VIRPGSEYAKTFALQKALPGTQIPTLAEVFALVRKSGNAAVKINIETKIDPTKPDETLDPAKFAAAVLDVIRREGFTQRVMIQSFDWRTLQMVQRLMPGIQTVYLTQQQGAGANVFLDKPSAWTAGFDPVTHGGSVPSAIKEAGGAIWSPLYVDVTPELVNQSHALGIKVVAWTVNDAGDMAKLIDMGVDGIISDRPDLLREVARSKNLPLPQRTPIAAP